MRVFRVAAVFAFPAGLWLGGSFLAGLLVGGLTEPARAQGLPPINLLADGPAKTTASAKPKAKTGGNAN